MIAAWLQMLVLLGAAQASPASSAPRWSLRIEPAHCFLERRAPDSAASLSIDTVPGSDAYRIAITGSEISGTADARPATLTFGPSQAVLKGRASATKSKDAAPLLWMQGLPPSLLDHLAGAQSVTIETVSNISVTVPLAGMAKAIEALRRCTVEQLVEWGADPAQFAPGGMPPVALTERDYWIPDRDLLSLAHQSQRRNIDDDFRVTVGADGAITSCHAVAAVTEPGLEKAACAAVTKRRFFAPAKDANGKPLIGAATFRISLFREPG